ncbi:porin [Rhodopseudomonas sp. BR0M22]|uniref:porin n=1 Tax=Rhodopseudomonas sp. BR0M22 TaxID=2269369 RepID=UPI0013DFB8C8|nr:porin [Rhodopseudomonas sp. BR0M22]NEW91367.1 porin [Rhodopseudomonas sp. BR0M22]
MNFAKSLMLGGAALLVATAGAQAADLPLKAKAVEYVKVCSLYGAGFYYVPGTDTCIKLGGFIRAEYAFNAGGMTETPSWNSAAGQGNRTANNTIYRSRADLNIDTRTATEYGVVRTYFDAVFTWTSGAPVAGGDTPGVYFAFVQFAGFTFGKAVSQFSTPWNGAPGNITSNLLGGDDTSTGINQISYTAEFGNGVSASISLEDQSSYRWAQGVSNVINANGGTAASWLQGTGNGTSYTAGTDVPDIVGKVRVDQAWGLFQVSAAAHQVRASYYNPALETSGHPSDKWGFAVLAALSLKNLPTGPGDSINLDATYADGATRYVIGGTSPNAFAMYSSSGVGAYQSVGFGAAPDGVFAGTNNLNGTGISTVKAWGIRGAFNHNWNPYWATSIFGAYSSVDFGGTGGALYNAALAAAVPGFGTTYTGNPNFNIAQIGVRTAWTPVKNLTFSGEVMWMRLDQNYSGVTAAAISPTATKPTAVYEFKDQDTVVGAVRVQRTF